MGYYPSLVLSAVLLIWFLASVIKYFPLAKQWVVKKDVLSLVPTWNFFAPEPNQTDYYFYYRVFSDYSESPWRLASFGSKRKWYGFIWNPYRRDRKSFFDICQILISTSQLGKTEVMYSMPYLLLLNHVDALCSNEINDKIQFAIAMTVPSQVDKDLSIAFVSESHLLTSYR